LEQRRVLVHIDAGDSGLAHANAGSAVPGDEATEELEEIGIVSNEQDVLPVGILVDQLLEIGVASAEVESRTDFNLGIVAKLIANKLGCLQSALERAGDDDVWLDFEGAEEPAHEHALLFAFGDEATFGIEFCALTRNTGVGVTHQVEVHGGGWACAGRSILRRQREFPA